ncbi:MAG: hypothetical protein NC409_13605 [Clostridium sp.]|nr:hypothetical protein [Clostridium sp.]
MNREKTLRHKSRIIVAVLCMALFATSVMAAPIQVFAAEAAGTYVVRTTQRCSIWRAPATTEENRIRYVDEGYQITVYPEVIPSEVGDGKTFYRTLKGAYVLCRWVALEDGSDAGTQEQTAAAAGLVQTDAGYRWMQEDGTYAADCWLYEYGLTYHLDEEGYIQTGITEIDGKKYYLYPEGKIARGWKVIEGDWYFFNFSGEMAVDTVVDGLLLGSDGKAVLEGGEVLPPRNELRQNVDAILESIITPGMTEEEKISACYWYVANTYTYKRTYETPSGDWTGGFALEIMTTGQGNCFRFAAAFAYLVNELGYEAKVITGKIGTRSGGMTPHGWTEVKIGGEWIVFDTELQYAHKDRDYYWKTYETYPSKPLEKQQEWPVSF